MLSGFRFDFSTTPIGIGCPDALHLESTLEKLLLWECQVESDHLGKEAVRRFQENPLLPGVIMTEQGKFVGMISRWRFLEHLSRPYGLELFGNRSLTSLYRFAQTDNLIIPIKTNIVEAAKQSLQRPAELLNEPIVVEVTPQDYKLLDVHKLLVAQSQIHEKTTQLLYQTYQQLKIVNLEFKRLASLDGLTQLANRRSFDEYLHAEWQRSISDRAPLSLILCDIDFFKNYNDACGHLAGDQCLREVAVALRETVKQPANLVARYGGEEFAIILPNTDAAGGVLVAESIVASIRELQLAHPNSRVSPFVTLSCGVAGTVPSYELMPARMIAVADKALYKAKAAGRDRVVVETCDGGSRS
ncbi:diguanylate cyclase domain-containing protein [Microcoleus sp. FACHB-672]|uniref:diguanylate cyclase domain-containing protein n=1 Tax=Microcoleus sp. FACHB-672 TaxID=2692825 RepID=UPI0016846C61|nr:diguanylate cyclase [Microcoleus sp. FACHB-672]MBD2041581.1 diguanylate cyclase [Microcoleus sp. FACHB-672]